MIKEIYSLYEYTNFMIMYTLKRIFFLFAWIILFFINLRELLRHNELEIYLDLSFVIFYFCLETMGYFQHNLLIGKNHSRFVKLMTMHILF